jgi:hypothetical protein
MKSLSITTFVVSGFSVGIVTTALGQSFATVIAIGAGPLFLVGLLIAVALTNAWPKLKPGPWRYIVALIVSFVGYAGAVFAFSLVFGYSPGLFGMKASNDIADLGIDVFCGLLLATIFAAFVIEVLVAVMTARWSSKMLLAIAVTGICSVFVSALGRGILLRLVSTPTPTYRYWSFFGVLFSLTEASFAGAIGLQLGGSNTRSGIGAKKS